MKAILGFVFMLALLLLSVDVEAQCITCKAAIESNLEDGADATGRGINDGIIYIMFVPYLLIGIVGYFAYKHYQKINKATA